MSVVAVPERSPPPRSGRVPHNYNMLRKGQHHPSYHMLAKDDGWQELLSLCLESI